MIIVKVQGGLGNQMFQYAFGSYLSNKHHCELKFDLSFLRNHEIKSKVKKPIFRNYDLSIFGIEENQATEKEIFALKKRVENETIEKVLNKFLGLKTSYVLEKQYQFSSEIFSLPNNVYLEGYWQSEKYFKPIASTIRKQFIVKEDLLLHSNELLAEITSKNSVCVNVRRGDFVSNSFHGTIPLNFYDQGEMEILKSVDHPHLYVFSDDLEWCYQNLNFKSPVTFVNHGFAGHKFQDYLTLMMSCKYFIIPNSTFAWWAAYLSSHPDKIVICPEKWFNDEKWGTQDLLLADWIKLSC